MVIVIFLFLANGDIYEQFRFLNHINFKNSLVINAKTMIIFKFPQLFKIILKFCIGNLNKEGVDTTL